MTPEEYAAQDAVGLGRLLRAGDVSAVELLDAAAAVLHRDEPELNALVSTRLEAARADASRICADDPRPLAGVPFLTKDTVASAGEPLTLGCAALRDHVATRDTPFVARLRAAGLVLIGRTTSPEFGATCVTESLLHGITRSPWDPGRSPGGSSGGAAVAVAAGYVPAAQAGDTGGSIRGPAAGCGLLGLRPTRGRARWWIDRQQFGADPYTSHGVLTRTVRDTAALLDAMQEREPGFVTQGAEPPAAPFAELMTRVPGRLRVLATRDCTLSSTGPLGDAAVEEGIALLRQLGHDVREVSLPLPALMDDPEMVLAYFGTGMSNGLVEAEALLGRPVDVALLEPSTRALVERTRSHPRDLARLLGAALQGPAARVAEALAGVDVLLTPTLTRPMPAAGATLGDTDDADEALARLHAATAGYGGMFLHNHLDRPAVTVPVQPVDGHPAGVQLAAARGRDGLLLALAAQLEAGAPWAGRHPDRFPA
jgi:amidase